MKAERLVRLASFRSVSGDADVSFPFPMDLLISVIGNAAATDDAHRISSTWKEASPTCHFDFKRGKGFVIASGKCVERETENGAQYKYKQLRPGEQAESRMRRSERHLKKLCTVGKQRRNFLRASVSMQ